MPASRKARAITLAPRSCPSRPGFAITTRSFLAIDLFLFCNLQSDALYHRNLFVLAPDLAKRVAHFPHGGIRPHRIENGRHEVLGRSRCGAQPVDRALNLMPPILDAV